MATVTLNATALPGGYKLSLAGDDLGNFDSLVSNYGVTKLTIIANEVTDGSDSFFKSFDVDPYQDDGTGQLVLITTKIIDSSILPLGKKTFLFLRYVFGNNTIVNSNVVVLINKSAPEVKTLIKGTNLRTEDSNLSINPSSLGYSLNSSSDGYSPITSLIVYVSKVNGSSSTDFNIFNVDMTLDGSSNPIYDKWYLIAPNSTTLDNGVSYEISYAAKNIIDVSSISNTIVAAPADVPSEITKLQAISLLADQRRRNVTLDDSRGDIVLYFERPSDFDNLLNITLKPVTQYVITEYEIGTANENDYVIYFDSSNNTYTGVLPAQTTFSVGTYDISGNTTSVPTDIVYHYKFTILGNISTRLGKQYKYTIKAFNTNGNSPLSVFSNQVTSFIIPELQNFTLNHNSKLSPASGEELYIYDGSMNMTFNSLSSSNGGANILNGGNVKYFLRVVENITPSNLILDEEVLFIPIKDLSGNILSYKYDFNTLLNDGSTLNNNLVNGKKYTFSLFRLIEDLSGLNTNNIYSSSSNDILRTKFKSPSLISKLQAYAVDDNFKPLTSVADASNNIYTLNIKFVQLTDAELNGMDSFQNDPNAMTIYSPYRNSNAVSGAPTAIHDYSNTSTNKSLTFTYSGVANTYAQQNLYVRGKTYNPELGIYINHDQSSPIVTETPFSPPIAVQNMRIDDGDLTSTSAIIKFTPVTNGRGSSLTNLQYRLVLYKDGVTGSIHELITPHDSAKTTDSFNVNSLTTGHAYTAFIITERLYTKTLFSDNAVNLFDSTVIFGEYNKINFIPIGKPTLPTNVETFPSSDSVTVYYDPPDNLGGFKSADIKYHFYLNKISDNLTNNISVADTSLDTQVVLTDAFDSSLNATDRNNMSKLTLGIVYFFNMRVIGNIPSFNLQNQLRNYSLNVSYNSGTAVSNIEMVPTLSVNQTTVYGESLLTNKPLLISSNTGITPLNVDVAPQNSSLKVVLDKNTNASELFITVDYNDALDISSNPIAAFDTRNYKSGGFNGLFLLDSYLTDPNTGNVTDAAIRNQLSLDTTSNFIVEKITASGGSQDKYSITIPNLENGRVFRVSVQYMIYSGIYEIFSEQIVSFKAPEAPPTKVNSPIFYVDNNTITVNWEEPSNTGGAGVAGSGNSDIQYYIRIISTGIDQTFSTNSTTYTFNNLNNGVEYRIAIAAFYIKDDVDQTVVTGPYVDANGGAELASNASPILAIKPNKAPIPVNFTLNNTNTNNNVAGTITLQSSDYLSLYPLSSIQVILRQKSSPNKSVITETITSGLTTGANSIQITNINDTSTTTFSTNNSLDHNKPLNGFTYELVIRCIPNYTYAQAPPDKIIEVTPYGNLKITGISLVGLATNKQYNVTVNLNGTGDIQSLVALCKGANQNLFGVLSVGIGNSSMPVVTKSGALENASGSNYIASNQIASFTLALSSVLSSASSISDLLLVATTQLGSDTYLQPTSGNFFS